MTSMRRIFIFFCSDFFFVILILFEILPLYSIFDSFDWLREYLQWTTDKGFIEELLVLKASKFSARFFLNFWFLPVFFVVFMFIRLIVMSY